MWFVTANVTQLCCYLQFLCKLISQAVGRLCEMKSSGDSPSKESPSPLSCDIVPLSLHRSSQYARWPALALKLADYLSVDIDILKRHHVCELYSASCDKLAEEVGSAYCNVWLLSRRDGSVETVY